MDYYEPKTQVKVLVPVFRWANDGYSMQTAREGDVIEVRTDHLEGLEDSGQVKRLTQREVATKKAADFNESQADHPDQDDEPMEFDTEE
jgi:hypothetical protein